MVRKEKKCKKNPIVKILDKKIKQKIDIYLSKSTLITFTIQHMSISENHVKILSMDSEKILLTFRRLT